MKNKSIEKENNHNFNRKNSKKKIRLFTKFNILILFIPLIISINIYLYFKNPEILELNEKVKELEYKIESLEKEFVKKKIKIAFVSEHIFLNGIARFLTVLAELLVKTGKYDVYIINEQSNEYDFSYHKKIKRAIVKKEYQEIKDFDEANDIQIYILNNDFSNMVDIYHSFGKKVIGIFHGVYLSCVFQNETSVYASWQVLPKFDSFVHIIPDDYWVYKKFGFNNTIYIPNIITFEAKDTPSSPLTYQNLLMVGRVDDVIKGAKYGILAMSEIVKKFPDAQLTIIGLDPPQEITDLIEQLNLEDNIHHPGFSTNITEFYLNTSVLLVTSVSESYPMVLNEGKAHGLPIVAFNIDYSPCFEHGVITVEMFDYKAMAQESVKLLKNYQYRKKKGQEAKKSLDLYETNAEKVEMWDKLFHSLLNSKEDYNKLQREVEQKYYNEELAKEHLEKHYHYGQQFNEYFRCHSFEDFTTLDYINNIKVCKI